MATAGDTRGPQSVVVGARERDASQEGGEQAASSPEYAFDGDQRERVPRLSGGARSEFPAVIQVNAHMPCCGLQAKMRGTCWAVECEGAAGDSHAFVTAAHVLCCNTHKRVATTVDLIERADDTDAKLTSLLPKVLDNKDPLDGFYCFDEAFFSAESTDKNWMRHDFGVIVVKKDTFKRNLSLKVSFHPLAPGTVADTKVHGTANICGYPAYVNKQLKAGGELFEVPWNACKDVADVTDERKSASVFCFTDALLRYYLATSPGQSGGSLYVVGEDKRMRAIGIHHGIYFANGVSFNKDTDFNCAVAVTQLVLDQVKKWINDKVGTKQPTGMQCAAVTIQDGYNFADLPTSSDDSVPGTGTKLITEVKSTRQLVDAIGHFLDDTPRQAFGRWAVCEMDKTATAGTEHNILKQYLRRHPGALAECKDWFELLVIFEWMRSKRCGITINKVYDGLTSEKVASQFRTEIREALSDKSLYK